MENGKPNEDSTTKVVVIHQLFKLFRSFYKKTGLQLNDYSYQICHYRFQADLGFSKLCTIVAGGRAK